MRKSFFVFVLLISFTSCIYSSEYSKKEIKIKFEKNRKELVKKNYINCLSDNAW